MPKQLEGYQEMLELIEKKYPGRAFLKPKEVADITNCNIKTVMGMLKKRHNALPSKNISAGLKNRCYIIPIPEFIRWSLGRR